MSDEPDTLAVIVVVHPEATGATGTKLDMFSKPVPDMRRAFEAIVEATRKNPGWGVVTILHIEDLPKVLEGSDYEGSGPMPDARTTP